jgi:hypothetical protein
MTPEGSDRAPMFSRAEIERGLPARRASGVLFAVEALTARLVVNQRITRATFVGERSSTEREQAFLQAIAAGRDLPVQPTIQQIERFAPQWADVVPEGAEARAALAILMAAKYRLVRNRVPRIRATLGLDAGPVAEAVARQLVAGRSLYVERPTLRETLAWRRAAFAQRIEALPPFWVAYALALTETITEGILVVPVAVAGIGPLAGVVVLVALGIVNLITLGALVEAITRNGSMRYGAAYLGRLVSDLLGRSASVSLSVALGVFNAVVLLVYMLGFGSVLSGATGIGEEVWVALLFGANVWILRRGQLDETVATAVVLGVVNISLILAITGIALANVDPSLLASKGLSPFAGGLDPVILQLVFGVIIVSYFGHTSAANASKLILGRDPSGRSLLFGNLAALATTIALYCLIVVAVNGAVGPGPLVETRGTAITPLAERIGPIIDILGSLYVVLAVGLGSLYCSLGLYNQVVEYLPARSALTRAGAAGLLARPRGRLLAGIAPLVFTFATLEFLLVTDQDWFARPIAVVGVLTVPLIGGIFPMLLVLAARRRGQYVPGRVIGFLGRPVVVAVVSLLFLSGILVHGLVIWTDPFERAAALVVAAATVLLGITILRGPAFRPAAAIELRDAQRGAPMDPGFSITVAGRLVSADVELHHRDGRSDLRAASGPLALDGLQRATFNLGDHDARTLSVWVHRVTREGESIPIPADVELLDGTGRAGPMIRSAGELLGVDLPRGSTRVAITLPNAARVGGIEA